METVQLSHPVHHKRRRTGEYYRVLILRTLGNFLILSSLFLIGKTFYQPVREEIRYYVNSLIQKQYVVAGTSLAQAPPPAKGGLAKLLNLNQVEILTPVDANFSIVIPKIGANSVVIPDVDAADEKAYLEALKHGVAHTKGTCFPGEGCHIYIFAHSTDSIFNVGTYNAVFYLLYKLEVGDEINIFYKNERYVYKVTDTKIVHPDETDYITKQTDSEFLTLQTCWPPGTSVDRLLVFAKRVAE